MSGSGFNTPENRVGWTTADSGATLWRIVNKRNCIVALVIAYIVLAVLISAIEYDPLHKDMADASTNYIWVRLYADGIYEVPYDEWTHGMTQSVVVEHNGEYVVVNEKGPGLVLMILPFHLARLEMLFGPAMAGTAVLSTYMLGRRLAGWKVGYIAATITLFNLTVIVMWHRYYWTDAATMHLLILSIWLVVESNYWFNGRSLNPHSDLKPARRKMMLALGLAALSGLAFGGSVATRYPVALVIVAIFAYVLMFTLVRAWPYIRELRIVPAIRQAKPMAILVFFTLGLLIILIPLMQYNTEYFGGPLASGYDATPLNQFKATGGIQPRNSSELWTETTGQGIIYSVENFWALLPLLIFRMPAMLFAPLGIWLMRKNRAVITMMLLWIAIALYTYLSLSWITMYNNPHIIMETIWEPRYFMPALPAISILGAVAISWLAFDFRLKKGADGCDAGLRPNTRKTAGTIFAGVVVLAILMPGIIPVYVHYSNPVETFHPPPPHPPMGEPVTTDMLILNPSKFEGRIVLIKGAVVTDVFPNGCTVRCIDAKESGSVYVRLFGWPPDQAPKLHIGDVVEINGMFIRDIHPEAPSSHFIRVQFGTPDYVRISK